MKVYRRSVFTSLFTFTMDFSGNLTKPKVGKERIVNCDACNKITANQSEKPQQHEPPLAGAFFAKLAVQRSAVQPIRMSQLK